MDRREERDAPLSRGGIRVQILVTADCPHAAVAIHRTREVLGALAPGAKEEVITVRDRAQAMDLRFPGSLEPGGPGLACRMYGGEGAPPSWLVEAAVLRALAPRHVLFLCVANSARSQMAEGVARSMAGKDVKISSAGSAPTQVRPEALQVLAEIGIDAGSHRSKGMDEVQGNVEAVITLCAEEVCPAWLGNAWRVHWGLPDPAGVEGENEERLDAFREVRDELRRRLSVVFGDAGG
jgi:arsenate reductase